MLILNLVADIFVLLPVGILCAYQTYYIASNTTTIESWEKDRVQSMTRQKLISAVPFPYDLGPMRNFRSVLGQNILLWLWPGSVRPIADGKGLRFDTIENFSGGTLSVFHYCSHSCV
jgi:palmitoyltransferase